MLLLLNQNIADQLCQKERFTRSDFPNKGVFSTTRTCAKFYSESQSDFGDRSL